VVDVGLADGEASFCKRSVANEVEFRVVVGHLDVESKVLEWFLLVKGLKQCQNTVKEAAGIPGEFVSLVCLKQCSLAHLVHDIQN
jgi:hypothetical protein